MSSVVFSTVLVQCVCLCEQDSPDLLLLLRMLSLGQGAWDMIDSQVFKEPRLVRIHTDSNWWVMQDFFCIFF